MAISIVSTVLKEAGVATARTKLGLLELDASVSETHSSEVEITDHPVEVGANISDHAREKPDTLTIEGVVSAIPLTGTDALRPPSAVSGRVGNAYVQLLAMKASRELVTVVTDVRTYEDLVLERLSVPRTSKTGGSLRFQATFKQIRLASSQTVDITAQLKGKTKGGPKVPQVADQPTQDASAWYQLEQAVKL